MPQSTFQLEQRKFGNADRVLKEKTKRLEELQFQEKPGNMGAIKNLQQEIKFILEQEDIRWKQRGKQNWYRDGDRNTQFFHSWANHRRKVNQIVQIMDTEGRLWKKQHEIGQAFASFYQELFTAGDTTGVDVCLDGLEAYVTDEMNSKLLKEFTAGEVELALNQMHPLKSPGPDGFAACFYQKS